MSPRPWPGLFSAFGQAEIHPATFIPGHQTYDLNFVNYDNDNRYYVYVYAHTRREMLKLVEEVDKGGCAHASGKRDGHHDCLAGLLAAAVVFPQLHARGLPRSHDHFKRTHHHRQTGSGGGSAKRLSAIAINRFSQASIRREVSRSGRAWICFCSRDANWCGRLRSLLVFALLREICLRSRGKPANLRRALLYSSRQASVDFCLTPSRLSTQSPVSFRPDDSNPSVKICLTDKRSASFTPQSPLFVQPAFIAI